jgi:hypothetical protein
VYLDGSVRVCVIGLSRLRHSQCIQILSVAVTCGPQASVYCFKCADWVNHDIFDQERERIDLNYKIPRIAWKQLPMQRSFDAFQFLHVPDQGIFWKGMFAAYVSPISAEHVIASRASLWRLRMFHGQVDELPRVTTRPRALEFAALQGRLGTWRVCDRHLLVIPQTLDSHCATLVRSTERSLQDSCSNWHVQPR